MKIVNKVKEIEPFSTKQLDNIIIEKNNDFYFIKCTFDKGKGQLELVIHKDEFERLFLGKVKEQIKWLLKEIEKEQKSAMKDLKEIKYRKNPLQHKWLDGYIDGLVHAEVKIKKAFSGVIENEV